MKSTILNLVAGSALVGCAVNTASPNVAASPMPKTTTAHLRNMQTGTRGYTSALVSENKYEIKYSGPWLGSRDALEGGLLHRAALLAKEHGSTSFRFLHLPGEDGPLSHPRRLTPSFGSAYGHWQPHWGYRSAVGWQPWHPERGDPFWADRFTKYNVEVEVHAMIELRHGAIGADEQMDFDVSEVLRDLKSFGS